MAAISPWYQGATSPLLQITLVDTSGNYPPNLGSATLSLVIHDQSGEMPDRAGANGSGFTVTGATTGGITYQFVAADVSIPGNYRLYVSASYSSGAQIYIYDLGNWQVIAV